MFGCSHLSVVHSAAPSCVCYLWLIIENFVLLKSPREEISKKEKSPTCYQSQVQGKPPKTLPVLPMSCRVKHEMFLQTRNVPGIQVVSRYSAVICDKRKRSRKKSSERGGKRFLLYSIRLYLFPH